ncbi:helix-turn-helix domain-containing protein [Myxococcus landrumensis]|uniref:helix-turn-helix domain-containing protein n=1 Tax=Myxococcus landrumensis TaxID=2813577 RepID=UPI001F51196E|nr:helix-turn-helix domain-containing protein [Myxococcus landrumus]
MPHAFRVTAPSLQVAPRGLLASFVRGLRAVTRGEQASSYVRLPDGESELIVRLDDTHGDAYVIGTRLMPLQKGGADVPPVAIAVRFKVAGAYPFFGVPMGELTNRVIHLDRLWGREGSWLRERLHERPSLEGKLGVLQETLEARLRGGEVFEPPSAHVVRRAVRVIAQARELPRVDALAKDLGVSDRQLRRAFEDVVGLGPKAYARVVRLQRALRASRRVATPDWGAIAAATGYYDQAHLISDFRGLTGHTPGALLRRSPPWP